MSVTESAVRSRLTRKGYVLHKSRSRNPDDPNDGVYFISDPFHNIAVADGYPFTYSLDLDDAAEAERDLGRNDRLRLYGPGRGFARLPGRLPNCRPTCNAGYHCFRRVHVVRSV